jgi:hypothetical protein
MSEILKRLPKVVLGEPDQARGFPMQARGTGPAPLKTRLGV